MKIPDNIYLVGSMGAGKSTVGRRLATTLGKDFYDCDGEIESRTGASINLIFELEGEDGFRRREQLMLDELTEKNNIVLATGGGAILDSKNRAKLRSRGFVIYLSVPIERLLQRTARDRKRPLLQSDDPRASLEEILAERDPLYHQVADMIVKADQRNVRHVANNIIKLISEL